MSYFKANTISISKDFKTFKVKGGDNNVRPLYNNWTNNIDIVHLFDDLNGGGVHLKSYNEKSAYINFLVKKYNKEYGGNFNDETDYWHEKRNIPNNKKVVDFDKKFLTELKTGLKNLSNKKEYVLRYGLNTYVIKITKKRIFYSYNKEYAKLFSKYHAIEYANTTYHDLIIEKI